MWKGSGDGDGSEDGDDPPTENRDGGVDESEIPEQQTIEDAVVDAAEDVSESDVGWEDRTDERYDQLKIGDKIRDDDGDEHVVMTATDNHVITKDREFVDPDEIDSVRINDEIDPPDGFDEWNDITDLKDDDSGFWSDLDSGDKIHYYDEEADEMAVGVVDESFDGAERVVIDDGTEVLREDIDGYADLGQEPLPEAVKSTDQLAVGDYVEISHYGTDGDVEEVEGMVIRVPDDDGYGVPEVTLYDVDDGEAFVAPLYEDGSVVSGEDESFEIPSPDLDDGETPADFIADRVDIERGVVDKMTLKANLMHAHDPDSVQQFHDLIGNTDRDYSPHNQPWKMDAGSGRAAELEAAYNEALGIGEGTRGLASADEGVVAVAETMHELSRRQFGSEKDDMGQLRRGLSDPGAAGLVSKYLSDPEQEAYKPPLLSVNNFTTDAETAENLGGDDGATIVVSKDVSEMPDDAITSYHDEFWRTPNDNESEITLRGDRVGDFSADQIDYTGGNVDFGKTPAEWSAGEAQSFNRMVEHYSDQDLFDVGNANETRLAENLLRAGRVMESKGVDPTADAFDQAREILEQNGYDPTDVEAPTDDG